MSIFSDPVLSGQFLKARGWPLYTGSTVISNQPCSFAVSHFVEKTSTFFRWIPLRSLKDRMVMIFLTVYTLTGVLACAAISELKFVAIG